jgi:chromosome segregation protein
MTTTRLKSLELHGYKTFASRTIFEFPGEITSIVGPNGSGKSNVADAIRWVLGEQSYSLLRGRKTEDMIFAGSEYRPRAGMASATITFDNQDGWLPIDFTEVAIARRAYRDGQNEYLLNGQKVRLKEISELLAQSGLAERTYTIIGQGLVDAALSLRPEERRRFFEEAAGIRLYRRRREESMNRLAATRRNLERVLDILSEIEPRLRSLEKQARRAQEFERITADLKVLLREWYGFHWHQAQRSLKYSQKSYKDQEGLLNTARQQQAEGESELETLHDDIQKLRVRLNGWHTQSSELHKNREQISRKLAVFNERRRAYSDQQQTLKSDLTRMKEEQRSYEERLEIIFAEKEQLEFQLGEAKKNFEEAEKTLLDRQMMRADFENRISETRKQLSLSESLQVKQRAKENELRGRRESLSQLQKTALNDFESTTLSLAKLVEDRNLVDAQYNEAIEKAEKLEISLKEIQGHLNISEGSLQKVLKEVSALEVDKSRLVAHIEVLAQAEKSLSGYDQGPKYILEEAKKGHLSGIYQAISNLIEVPAKFEAAIASVLGDSLQGIMLNDSADLEEALSLLQQGEKGRTVLFPLSSIRHADRENLLLPDDSAIFGFAKELIQGPDNIHTILQIILSGVIIVRDRKSARRLLKQTQGERNEVSFVTLEGEIFLGNGKVVAGRDGKTGLISRSRQKRELQISLDKIKVQQQKYSQIVVQEEELLKNYRSEENEIQAELDAANQAVVNKAILRQAAQLEEDTIQQKVEWQRKQLQSAKEQIQELKLESDELVKESLGNTDAISSNNEKIRQANRDLNGLPIDDFQTQVAHWKTSTAVAERALQDASRRLEEYQQEMKLGTNQFDSLKERNHQNDDLLNNLENERAELRDEEQILIGSIGKLSESIEPADQDLEAQEKKFSELQRRQLSTQQETSAAERNMAQAHIERTRQNEAMETLRGKVEEDFGLVDFEYVTHVSGPTPLPLDGMVEQLPFVNELTPDIEEGITRQRTQLRRLGAVNPEAQNEFIDVQERYKFLKVQVEDLKKADSDLCQVISELDELMMSEFQKTFEVVAREFRQMFTQLFGGGSARLVLTDAENLSETGIDIEARLPGRREQGLALLSGGERSLTAVALVFSLLKVSPTPFCVLDEVDAMLDESNVGRFGTMLQELSENTQFIVVTHNRGTVQTANVIYGVTMGRDSSSQIISLKLDEVNDEMVGSR